MKVWRVRAGVVFAILAFVVPMFAALPEPSPHKNEFFKGKVVLLKDALAPVGVRVDDDAAPYLLALIGDDRVIFPLVKDAGSRMLYQDKSLRNRPLRLTARRLSSSNLLQVINVHSYVKGKLHEVYYWCDICTIRGYQFTICDCCGGPMEKREVPVDDKK